VHSANGYLIHQFLDTGSNTRTDEFGGSIENRCRLGLEILRELIDVWGPGRVGIKLNPCAGYNDTGCVHAWATQ
jgi:2,4-dienoyl-CoA reductase-like NADH-dependent reductase (Old Yellow Enzyme family)